LTDYSTILAYFCILREKKEKGLHSFEKWIYFLFVKGCYQTTAPLYIVEPAKTQV